MSVWSCLEAEVDADVDVDVDVVARDTNDLLLR